MRESQRAEGRRRSGHHRNLELALVLFAVAISLGGWIMTELTLNNRFPSSLPVDGGALTALALAAHFAVRRFARYADPLILPIAVMLSGFGLVLLHRLDISYALVHAAKGDYQKYPFAPNQIMWMFIAGLAAIALIVFVKHHRFFQRYVYVLMVGALVLLAAPAFFPGDDFGAKRWIKLGGLSFEPDEFVKLAITVFFAGYLMASRDALALVGRKIWGLSLPRGRNAGPVLAIWVISLMVLIFERDLGTSLIFFGVFIVMLYIATERTSWVIFGLLMAVGGAAVVGSLEPHVHGRVEAWLHPLDIYLPVHDKALVSDQPAQALFSFGTGHLLGTGLGLGRPWLIGFAGRSDFIFTTIGEELGLAGVTVTLLLYTLLVQRGLRTAIGLTDPFGKLLAAGLSAAVALQVFVVVGGVTGLIPLTGKALPFLAAGGSSLMANWLLVALLIKLSDAAGRTALEPAPDEAPVEIIPTPPAPVAPVAPVAAAVAETPELLESPAVPESPEAAAWQPEAAPEAPEAPAWQPTHEPFIGAQPTEPPYGEPSYTQQPYTQQPYTGQPYTGQPYTAEPPYGEQPFTGTMPIRPSTPPGPASIGP